MSEGRSIISAIGQRQDRGQFRKEHWIGSFAEYLDIVRERPDVTRNAFQRVYDMILAAGTEVYEVAREKRTHYRFFDDPFNKGADAIYGLDGPLDALVNTFKSAARGYGTEKRVLLLHGPVGSSKSTIARLLKKGLEHYSASDAGMLFTSGLDDRTTEMSTGVRCTRSRCI